MEDSLNRIHQAIEYLKDKGKVHKQQDIADSIGMAKTHLSVALKGGNYFTVGFVKRFASAYSDFISEDWLLTGEGRMEVPDKTMKPHYDTKASAGFMDGISEGKMSAEVRAMVAPLPDYNFTIDVTGDSMMPEIKDGDVLMCRKLIDRLNPPIGKICVLDTKEGWVVKVIESVNEETITLHSLNPAYHDYEIDHNSILGVAEVVGLVRSFT